MDLLMNGLLTVATLFAGGYCWVLARRVRDLKSLDRGLGGAIVTLTRQIELARTTLDEAKSSSTASKEELQHLVARADAAAMQLRLLLAAAPAIAPAPSPAPTATPVVAAEPIVAAAPLPKLRPVEPPVLTSRAPGPATEEAAAKSGLDEAAGPRTERAPAVRKGGGLRAMLSQAPAPAHAEASGGEPEEAAVPKPRALVPIENPLRRFRPDPSEPAVASESDIMAALRALAGSES